MCSSRKLLLVDRQGRVREQVLGALRLGKGDFTSRIDSVPTIMATMRSSP